MLHEGLSIFANIAGCLSQLLFVTVRGQFFASLSSVYSDACDRVTRSVRRRYCRTPIVREVDLSSRSLHFCQLCQRLRSIGLGRPSV